MPRYQRPTLLKPHLLIIYHFKKTIMSNFQLNFNSSKKVVTIELTEEDAIFDLAILFKRLLDDAGIPNTISEQVIEEPKVEETA
jgi:hypothetical protein